MDNKTVYTVIFILILSALFPMVGYFLDWKHKKRLHHPKKK
ncbi:MAG: hypothetical protein NZ521_06360 [Flammeovirgaceae bacterium]|nr:hypothetical protein [Flammeovirgaceae bacterium]MDW8287853.1 hypothetical protein [Flammeovirgaceae bacterium]